MINDSEIILRKTEITDLEFFSIFQLDNEANYLAAFTSKDPTDKTAYLQKYTKFLNDRTINMQTIIVQNIIAGSIAKSVSHKLYIKTEEKVIYFRIK